MSFLSKKPKAENAGGEEEQNKEPIVEKSQQESEVKGGDRDKLIEQWQRDAKMLTIIVPDFDFDAMLKNEDFREMLAEGKSVFEAYASSVKSKSEKREEIFQNAQSRKKSVGEAEINPAKLDSSAFKKYIEKRRNRI